MRKNTWLAIALCLALGLTACAKKSESASGANAAPDNSPAKEYALKGEVIRLDPSLHIAVIKGEKIEGWMEAMTMEYPVKDVAEFQKLKAGEKIQASVFVKGDDYWVSNVQEASAAPAGAAPLPSDAPPAK